MGKRVTETNRPQRRNRLAGFLLLLLPGFMFVGILAPAAVRVKPAPPPVSEVLTPVTFEDFRYPKRPMLVRNERSTPTVIADAQAPNVFFSGARFVADKVQQPVALPHAQGPSGQNQILLAQADGVEEYVTDQILEEPEAPKLKVDLSPAWNSKRFDIIPPMLSRWGDSEFDDLVGDPVRFINGPPPAPAPVPEPGTVLLVATGLVALGLRRRSARR